MIVSDQSRVVQLDSLVEELALVQPVRLDLHVHHLCGHLLLELARFFSSRRSSTSIFGAVGIEPGADSSHVLVIGKDWKCPIELGKQVNLKREFLLMRIRRHCLQNERGWITCSPPRLTRLSCPSAENVR